MGNSEPAFFEQAQKTGEDYFNAGVDAIAARFGTQDAKANLIAASINALTMALDHHSSTMRRHTDLLVCHLDRIAGAFEELNTKLT